MTRALQLAAAIIPTLAFDVVGVYTQDYVQVFRRARPIKASVRPDSQLMEHPLEKGETVIDHRIFKPIEIEMQMIILPFNYKEVYQQIVQLYQNNTLLIVQTKSGTYDNQLIRSLPHEENAAMFNTIGVTIQLRESQFATATETIATPKNTKNAAAVNRGNQQTIPATPEETKKGSVLFDLFI